MLPFIMLIILIILIVLGNIVGYVERTGEKRIVSQECIKSGFDVIIVMGAGVRKDGEPSQILKDRLDTCINIYKSGIGEKILLTGDHGTNKYDEVRAMKIYLMNNCDIDEKNVFMDHAGFNTYDSIYRANHIFKVSKAIIVSNEYHLPRVLYLAEKHKIQAYGIESDLSTYANIDYYVLREKLAQFKDFIKINILKSSPKYYGDIIPINCSDGRLTDDKTNKNNL